MSLVQKLYKLNAIEYLVYIFMDSNSKIWFKAKEIAMILQYNNTEKAIEHNVEIEDKIEWLFLLQKLSNSNTELDIPKNWQPKTIFINESGLYIVCC